MNILGIDTATDRLSAALVCGNSVYERHKDSRTSHCELLTGFIGELVAEAGIGIGGIEGIAISTGPGSFTGLRIGIATAMGLAYGLGVKTAGIDTLMGIAGNTAGRGDIICPVIDAKRGEVYCGLYRTSEGILPEEIMPPTAMPLAKLAETVSARNETVFFSGPASITLRNSLENIIPDASCIDPDNAKPTALSIAKIGTVLFSRGEAVNPASISPIYLRRSDAEIARDRKKFC